MATHSNGSQAGTTHRVGVIQAASVAFDIAATLGKVRDLAADCRARGVRLGLFPEAFISGYPRGLSFGAVIGSRTPEGREEFRRCFASAIEVPGPETAVLAGVARDNRMHLVIGVIERERSTLYCTVLFFSPGGELLGKHRKLMPTASERLIWGCGDGSTLPVFPTELGRLGAVICWENYMPLLRTAMYAKGIEIYCAPTADGRDTWQATVRHIAQEGRCFVLSCNQFSRRKDYPGDYASEFGNEPQTVLSRGGSCIVSPLGQVLAGPNFEDECILTADIDLADIARSRMDFDPVGHYSRPDVFRLEVDETARPGVAFRDRASADAPASNTLNDVPAAPVRTD